MMNAKEPKTGENSRPMGIVDRFSERLRGAVLESTILGARYPDSPGAKYVFVHVHCGMQ